MGALWLNYMADYAFYLACLLHYDVDYSTDLSDDDVATYCMGGEL